MITLGPSNRARGGRPRRNAPLITTTHAFASCPSECGAEVARVWSREPTPPSHRLGHRILECVSCGATWLGAEWIYASGAGDCYRGEVAPMTLGEAMARVRDEVLPIYLSIGTAGAFAVAGMRRDLDAAAKAMAEGDVVAMLRVYESLKGWSL